jgi:hypothetical protein
VKATRHNSRLKNHGGMSIEELAATRKKKHNLETRGNKQPNTFAILNDVDDNVLIQTAKDLEISLDDNEVGCKEIISAMKAEERVRANLVEANYRAHLERLKHKECIQEDDILNLTIIDNSQRNLSGESDSNTRVDSKTARSQKENKRKKK